jgi:hypothetical protein
MYDKLEEYDRDKACGMIRGVLVRKHEGTALKT